MRSLFLLISLSAIGFAQNAKDNPQLASAKGFFDLVKGNVLKAAEKVPEGKFGFQPSPDVRTMGQLFAHIADAQYFFCGTVSGKPEAKGIEKSAPSKAQTISALQEAFSACDAVYAGLTDAGSAAMVTFLGAPRTKLSVMAMNTAHTYEHYGNLVTYMRINGIVPPSSEPK